MVDTLDIIGFLYSPTSGVVLIATFRFMNRTEDCVTWGSGSGWVGMGFNVGSSGFCSLASLDRCELKMNSLQEEVLQKDVNWPQASNYNSN